MSIIIEVENYFLHIAIQNYNFIVITFCFWITCQPDLTYCRFIKGNHDILCFLSILRVIHMPASDVPAQLPFPFWFPLVNWFVLVTLEFVPWTTLPHQIVVPLYPEIEFKRSWISWCYSIFNKSLHVLQVVQYFFKYIERYKFYFISQKSLSKLKWIRITNYKVNVLIKTAMKMINCT